MPAKIHRDQDADLSLLADKTVAVLGYGSQGAAQAQNLRDSGCRVIVTQRPGSPNYQRAIADGFLPVSLGEAVAQAGVIAILLPDEAQPELFAKEIRPHLSPGKTLVFAHGFGVRFGLLDVPEGVAVYLVSPFGPGSLVRAAFLRGEGVPCLVARRDAGDLALALAYAKAIGATRAGAIESTFAEETETDLFAEQAVLCGGMGALMRTAFDTLVAAGYQPEVAYFTCIHEVKQIVDLVYRGGLAFMRRSISNTAEYGDYTRGPRIVGESSQSEMARILEEIRDGRFAREWLDESRQGAPRLDALRRDAEAHASEDVGRRLRALMPWLDAAGD